MKLRLRLDVTGLIMIVMGWSMKTFLPWVNSVTERMLTSVLEVSDDAPMILSPRVHRRYVPMISTHKLSDVTGWITTVMVKVMKALISRVIS